MTLSQYTIALEMFVNEQEISVLTEKLSHYRSTSEAYDYYLGKISDLKRREAIYADRIIRTQPILYPQSWPQNSGIRAYQDPLTQQRRLE